MWHSYFTVDSFDAALRLLAEHRERARLVAGGTDLLIELERGLRPGVDTLIDLSRVPDADGLALDATGWLRLGPLATHNQCAASPLAQALALALAQACWEVGAPQIRNRATVVGNLVTASPANDTITPLMALEAQVTLASLRGTRVVPLAEFYTGVRRTVLAPDELVREIAFRALAPDEQGVFLKLALRRAQAISVVNAAVIVARDAAGRVTRARIALGAVAPTIVRATAAEAVLAGEALTPAVIDRAGAAAQTAARPIDDVRGSAAYRREMVRVLVMRALRAIAAGTARGALPEHPVTLGALRPTPPTPAAPGVIETRINGHPYTLTGGPDKTLLRLLREEAGLAGTKEGCADGECGACTVILDGAAVMSCLVPAPRAHGAEITTVEGLAPAGSLHPLQAAFVAEAAVQCGYCTPGFLVAGAQLLKERPHPEKAEIEQAYTGNLCRCTGYYKILAAVRAAANQADGV